MRDDRWVMTFVPDETFSHLRTTILDLKSFPVLVRQHVIHLDLHGADHAM